MRDAQGKLGGIVSRWTWGVLICLSLENAHNRDQWRLRFKGETANLGFPGKWPLKQFVVVVVVVYMYLHKPILFLLWTCRINIVDAVSVILFYYTVGNCYVQIVVHFMVFCSLHYRLLCAIIAGHDHFCRTMHIVQSLVLSSYFVRLSVTLMICGHIGCFSSKVITQIIRVFATWSPNISDLVQGEHPQILHGGWPVYFKLKIYLFIQTAPW